jgi:hypothetical protein
VIQQINLYQDCLKEKKDVFPPSAIGWALGIGLLGLLILFGLGKWKVSSLEAKFHDLQKRKAEILEAFKKVEDSAIPYTGDTLLQEELARVQSEVNVKAALLKNMEILNRNNLLEFSNYLETLGRHGQNGLWLTRIEVREAGKRITLEGSALHPWLVSKFTEELARQERFTGLTTAKLWIQNTESGSNPVNFILETEPGKAQ